MTIYTDGRRFEYAVRNDLEADGYWVMRSAGSKTKADLIAIKPGQILIIQCKQDGRVSPAERIEVRRIAAMIDGVPILAHKQTGRAKPIYDRLTGSGPLDRERFLTDLE